MKKSRTVGIAALAALASALPLRAEEPDPAGAVRAWLRAYDAAFNSKDLARLADFYDPEVTIFEGGGIDVGWPEYRDHHLGPELAEMQNLEFSQDNVAIHFLADGRAAYVTAEYRLKTRIGEKDVDAGGLATLVLTMDDAGRWRIRHSHTSARRRPAPSPSPAAPPKP